MKQEIFSYARESEFTKRVSELAREHSQIAVSPHPTGLHDVRTGWISATSMTTTRPC